MLQEDGWSLVATRGSHRQCLTPHVKRQASKIAWVACVALLLPVQCPSLNEPEMKMENTLQPRHFQPGEGKSYKIGRMTITFKTTASQDWNAYTVCEAIEPPED